MSKPQASIWVKFIVSAGFVGHIPWAPGTWGSLVGLALAYGMGPQSWVACLLLSLVGLALCKPATQAYNNADPKQFVLDEVCGMMLAVAFMPAIPMFYISAFLTFRVLDIFKPWPISKIQQSKNSLSIMADDLLAGLGANLLTWQFVRFLLFFPS